MSDRGRGRIAVLLGNTAIFALGSLAVRVVSLVLMPLYTSALTAAEYGAAELVNSGIEIALPLLSLGAVEALYRFSIDDAVEKRALFVNSLALLAGGGLGAFLVAVVGRYVFGFEHAWSFLALFVAASFYKATAQFARGLGHVRRYVLYGIVNAVVLVLASAVLLVHLRTGVTGYLWSYAIGYVVAGVTAFMASGEYRMVTPFWLDSRLLREMLAYSVPLVPNLLSWWVVSVSGRYVVLWGSGVAAAGLFAAASKMPALVNVITSVFQQAWQYSAAREIGSPDSGSFFGRVLRGYSLVALSMAGVVISLNRPIAMVLLQDEFQEARRYVPLLMLAAAFGVMSIFFETFYQALKKSRVLMVSTMMGAGTNVVLAVLLVPVMGPWGACTAAVVSYCLVLVVRLRDIASRVDMPIDRRRIAYQLLLLTVIALATSVEGLLLARLVVYVFLALLFASDIGVLRSVASRGRSVIRGRRGRG